ncbi:LysR family transcriptional regulator substrate-binding protein [Bradyrhizobium sp. NFR13]|uniref:LysR family transcriptional regulator substrate-binding protein n=1 Tax=Bradyrhizobium sp. NFR13 TaxID=1566285 RepID=UPI000B87AB67|nr:LysR family transcriptional regulator substrate-binding protein [Bradyrhizobium sp. NFR13]
MTTAPSPKIELYLQEDYALAVRDALLAGKIDLGIMSVEAQHPELASQALFEESMWLVGTPGNWTFRDSNASLRAGVLNDLPLIAGSFMHTLLKKHEIRGKFRSAS